MAFGDDESSTSQNRPADLFTITTPTVTYRMTSHPFDIVFAGQTYSAITMSRGNQQAAQDLTGKEFIVYLPIDHPIVQRFVATGIPEFGVLVSYQRFQAVSGQASSQWAGFATGISIDGHTALLRVPSVVDDAMKIKLPVVRAQRVCNHTLYDNRCTISRALFEVDTTIVSQTVSPTTTTLIVTSMGGKPDRWASFGEVLHGPTSQRPMILSQIGTTLTLNVPIVGAGAGDLVEIFAGCAHDVNTCRDKFANVVNFGGMPQMLQRFTPWNPGSGLGSVQQF